jgi:hypothetical protein
MTSSGKNGRAAAITNEDVVGYKWVQRFGFRSAASRGKAISLPTANALHRETPDLPETGLSGVAVTD